MPFRAEEWRWNSSVLFYCCLLSWIGLFLLVASVTIASGFPIVVYSQKYVRQSSNSSLGGNERETHIFSLLRSTLETETWEGAKWKC